MAKFSQGVYTPKNMKKYIGNTLPTFRSSWEMRVFLLLDNSPNVISWASEPIAIPYISPVDGRSHRYFPDLLYKYIDNSGKQHIELVEIKPKSQSINEHAKSDHDRIACAVNAAKWKQASLWCKAQGIRFRVLTEVEIFGRK